MSGSHIWMKRAFSALAVCAALPVLVGCGFSKAGFRTGENATTVLPAVSPMHVKFFGERPKGVPLHEVGVVVATAGTGESWAAMSRLRDAAAAMGADAVVDLSFEVIQTRFMVARGVAVVLGEPTTVVPAVASEARSTVPSTVEPTRPQSHAPSASSEPAVSPQPKVEPLPPPSDKSPAPEEANTPTEVDPPEQQGGAR